jgi:hypothetical protein
LTPPPRADTLAIMGRDPREPAHVSAVCAALALLLGAATPRPALASFASTAQAPTSEPVLETLTLPTPPPAPAEPPVAATPPPPRAAAPAAPRPRPQPQLEPERSSSGLRRGGVAAVAGGLSFFGLFYVVAAISGLALHDAGRKKLHDPDTAARGDAQIHAGNRMFIPLVGPWVAFPYLESDGKEGAAIVGTFQLFGALAAIAGAVMLGADARASRTAALRRRVFFTGAATPRHAGASLTIRF